MGSMDQLERKTLQQNFRVAFTTAEIEVRRFWAELLEQPRYADPRRLLRYGFSVYSQCDEDGILQEIFRRIGLTSRTFVEFGVENGRECNTAKLLVEGWRGLWMDGSQEHVASIRKEFDAFIASGRLTARAVLVTAENINGLLMDGGMAGEIDLLSIDIDNNDYWVWKAIDKVSPRVVAIEYNPVLRPPMSLVVPYDPARRWDGSSYYGASLEALVKLGAAKGYRIVGCNAAGVNAFFVRQDLCGDHFLGPATAEEHYEPERHFLTRLKTGHAKRPGFYETVP